MVNFVGDEVTRLISKLAFGFQLETPHVVSYVTEQENRPPSPLKIRAIKKAASVSEGRLIQFFAGGDLSGL